MPNLKYPLISAEEAAAQIPSGATVAFSGFSSAIVAEPMELGKMIAERVRAGFEVAGAVVAGHPVGATVSIGAATAPAFVTVTVPPSPRMFVRTVSQAPCARPSICAPMPMRPSLSVSIATL